MLRQRIITAMVLLAILLPALFSASAVPLVVLATLMIGAGCWEWGRMNGLAMRQSLPLGGLGALVCGLCWWQWPLLQGVQSPAWCFAALLWMAGGPLLLRKGVAGWPHIVFAARLTAGLLALWIAWLALVQAKLYGVNFLLSVLALVWVADVGAYFAGRALGLKFTRNRLAPTISPGKSWEGVWGAMACVLVLACVWVALDRAWASASPSFYSLVVDHTGWWSLPLVAVVMVAMGVVGDLAESLVKRSAGMKDSSSLLPGHGGVLDRIDAVLPTLPLALLFTSFARAWGP